MENYPKLTDVKALKNYRLELSYGENEIRIYDFKPNINHKYYSILSDTKLFRKVSVVDGELVWVTGQDFCPNTLYEQSTLVETENRQLQTECFKVVEDIKDIFDEHAIAVGETKTNYSVQDLSQDIHVEEDKN